MSLSIIIPAYKPDFLKDAIESVLNQTNQNFYLYIFNDASPNNLESVLSNFIGHENIIYHKFEDNLGGQDLVAHWNRCVMATNNEEWIWLFSDDDIMSPNCVEEFYNTLENTNRTFNLYRFNNYIIDTQGKRITELSNHPSIETSQEFLERRLSYSTHSYITDSIFSRNVFNQSNGFVNFDAAWIADDASWILFGLNKGIKLVSNTCYIEWRSSGINISTSLNNKKWVHKKRKAIIQFINWLKGNRHLSLDYNLLLQWHLTMLHLIGGKLSSFDFVKKHITLYPLWSLKTKKNRKQVLVYLGELIKTEMKSYKSIIKKGIMSDNKPKF